MKREGSQGRLWKKGNAALSAKNRSVPFLKNTLFGNYGTLSFSLPQPTSYFSAFCYNNLQF